MTVKFDIVRIGKPRRDSIAELILKQNVQLLQNSIQALLKHEEYIYGKGTMGLTMIIPGTGFNIKIMLQDVGEENIKKILKYNLPNSIYKGSYDILLQNVQNGIWKVESLGSI